MVKTRKEKLTEIKRLELLNKSLDVELAELSKNMQFTEKDLDKIEVAKFHLKDELNRLDKFSKTLDSKGIARLKELKKIVPKLEVQLNLDRNALQLKSKGVSVVNEGYKGFSVKKVGKSKITLFN